MSSRNVFLAAAWLVLLTGCGPTLQTLTIHPAELRTFVVSASDQATFSCPPLGCPPAKSGTGIGGAVAGEVTVGFDATYDPGTLPCNCWEWTSNAARGAVLFNTFKLPKQFATAILVLTPTNVKRIEGSNVSNDDSGTISAVFLPQADWNTQVIDVVSDANGTSTGIVHVGAFTPETVALISPFPESPGPSYPPSGPPVRKEGNHYEIDVTSQIKAWVKNSEPNFGFMLVGRDESLPSKTQRAWQANYSVVLRVLVNPNSP